MSAMRMNHLFLASLVLVALLSCASKDFQEPIAESGTSGSTSKTYQRSYTDVWNAVVSALGEKKYAVAVSKRDGGLIVTDWVSGKSDRLYSGYGDTRIPYTIRFKMTLKLTPTREGIRVAAKNEEQYLSDSITAGTDFNGSLYQWMNTPSSGAKEASLLSAVGEQLAPPPKDRK